VRKVIVYVEGPSDKQALQQLLSDLLARLANAGTSVQFVDTQGKKPLMLKTPGKAVNILLDDPAAVVIALPDLYPPNVGFAHNTAQELYSGLTERFEEALRCKVSTDDERVRRRFLAFCFKHDLEALVLAAEPQLASRLGIEKLKRSWIVPVEDQDQQDPPKRVVERLFRAQRQAYADTVDAPLILGAARYPDVAAACPQCFKPFVDYLESLLA